MRCEGGGTKIRASAEIPDMERYVILLDLVIPQTQVNSRRCRVKERKDNSTKLVGSKAFFNKIDFRFSQPKI